MIFAVADKMTSNTLTQSVISRKACNCGDHSVKLWRRTRSSRAVFSFGAFSCPNEYKQPQRSVADKNW